MVQREQLFKRAGIALCFSAPCLFLLRRLVPAFEWLSMVCALAGCFSIMAARQGPRKAVAGFDKHVLAFAGLWALIIVGLIVFAAR